MTMKQLASFLLGVPATLSELVDNNPAFIRAEIETILDSLLSRGMLEQRVREDGTMTFVLLVPR